MDSTAFLNGRVTLHAGDCLAVLSSLDENSIDSCVCDPPYHLASIVKRFSQTALSDETKTSQRSRDRADGYARNAVGFMGKTWDGGDIAFRPETWAAVLRVLKPGAHLVAFAAPKNAHRMFCAIEDGGFEIRDTIAWLFGSGFPKSHDVSKGIDRAAGAEREVVGQSNGGLHRGSGSTVGSFTGLHAISAPATDSARQWQGWGTALKPAYEPICLARKPLSEKTIAANVLRWGTGAINVDGCRVAAVNGDEPLRWEHGRSMGYHGAEDRGPCAALVEGKGRWPANVIHDGSDEVVEAFPESAGQLFGTRPEHKPKVGTAVYGDYGPRPFSEPRGDSGSAARFFFSAKADSVDRAGSRHPTVKPLDLMQYLVRLVTPPKGVVLDCFAGTGTTGEAAWREGFNAVLIEREPEYLTDIERRMSLCLAGPDERARESIKARLKGQPQDHGPLFSGDYERERERERVGGSSTEHSPKTLNRANRNDEVVTT